MSVWSRGAIAGLIGGLASGLALLRAGALPQTGWLPLPDWEYSGLVLHVAGGAVLGLGFALLMLRQREGAGETFFWGVTYGSLWWFIGPLTLLPLTLLGFIAWDVHSAQEAFPSFIGYLVYGAVAGLVLAALRGDFRWFPAAFGYGFLVRGMLAGLMGVWLVGREPVGLAIGILGGLGLSLLYPRPLPGTGPGLIRGMVYGFFLWAIAALTVTPLMDGRGLAWSAEGAQTAFTALPAYLLFGAAAGVIYQWLDALGRLLFSDTPASEEDEGPGTEGLRALGRGALAGLAGGALFTGVMVGLGSLEAAAGLIGSRSLVTGAVVQFVIAELIGASYGLLFRRQSYDIGSALGWGLSYGFFWWVLGPLTLVPVLQGAPPQWTVAAAGQLFPSLIGLLAYGAGLGIVYHLLEARHSPWWIPRTRIEAARVSRHIDQLLTSAPALWALVITIALTLPIVLSGQPR